MDTLAYTFVFPPPKAAQAAVARAEAMSPAQKVAQDILFGANPPSSAEDVKKGSKGVGWCRSGMVKQVHSTVIRPLVSNKNESLRVPDSSLGVSGISGSEREFDGWAILGCFLDRLNSDEFDVRRGHPLGLQQ